MLLVSVSLSAHHGQAGCNTTEAVTVKPVTRWHEQVGDPNVPDGVFDGPFTTAASISGATRCVRMALWTRLRMWTGIV